MAEGFIYVLDNPALGKDLLKIGKTTRSPEIRARELSISTGVPAEFNVIFSAKTTDCSFAESLVHKRLQQYRYSPKREFFSVPLDKVIAVIQDTIRDVAITPMHKRVFVPLISEEPKSRVNRKMNIEVGEEINCQISGKKNTDYISKKSKTNFRQNAKHLDGLDIYYSLSGSRWAGEGESERALVFFSRCSSHLVVIPREIVNEFIFNPLFERVSNNNYQLRKEFEPIRYDKRRISLKYSIEDSYLHVILHPKKSSGKEPVPLLALPENYWPKISLSDENPILEIIMKIQKLSTLLSSGQGIVGLQR